MKKIARVVVDGIRANTPTNFERVNLLLQRVVDKGGDSVLITTNGNHGKEIAYLMPTQHLINFLNESLESEA